MTDDRQAGRRSYDRDIDPVIENYVQEELRLTRHSINGQIAAVQTAVQVAALKSTEEHGKVEVKLQALQDAIDGLRAQSEALDRLRTSFRTAAFSLAALIVAAAGVIVAVHP